MAGSDAMRIHILHPESPTHPQSVNEGIQFVKNEGTSQRSSIDCSIGAAP